MHNQTHTIEVKMMELEDHIKNLKVVYEAFEEVEGYTDMTICYLTKIAYEQYCLDKRTKFIQEERAKYGRAGGKGDASWRDEPITTPQKGVLTRAGIAFNPDITKGQASDLIEKLTSGGK